MTVREFLVVLAATSRGYLHQPLRNSLLPYFTILEGLAPYSINSHVDGPIRLAPVM